MVSSAAQRSRVAARRDEARHETGGEARAHVGVETVAHHHDLARVAIVALSRQGGSGGAAVKVVVAMAMVLLQWWWWTRKGRKY